MRIFSFLFLVFFIAEIVSLVIAGRFLGVGLTILLLIADGVLGALLVRGSFRSTMDSLRTGGNTRIFSLLAGAQLKLISGLLFMSPGFASDIFALLLLLPPVRAWAQGKAEASAPRPRPGQGPVIEGEAVEVVVTNEQIEGPDRRVP